MSHREHATFIINATSKSSMSVERANSELNNCTVSTSYDQTIFVFGEITETNANIIDKYFEVYDNIHDSTELSLLEE